MCIVFGCRTCAVSSLLWCVGFPLFAHRKLFPFSCQRACHLQPCEKIYLGFQLYMIVYISQDGTYQF